MIRVGCSGWQYRHWRGDFYPSALPVGRWFEHYASVFDSVEVNNSFYRLPEPPTVQLWRERAPAGFLFAWKASRYLTHMKRLLEPAEPIERMMSRATLLGPKLGPILYQTPPRWQHNPERLAQFVSALPPRRLHAFEFRDGSWYRQETFRTLERAGLALCLHDMPGSEPPRTRVGTFVYVRFHGAQPGYHGTYSDEALRGWADWLREQDRSGLKVFAYFNNDGGGHAPRDALRLKAMLS